MDGTEITLSAAKGCADRMCYQGLKGKKRDDAAINYLAGACSVTGGNESPITGLLFIVSVRGFYAVTDFIERREAELAKTTKDWTEVTA